MKNQLYVDKCLEKFFEENYSENNNLLSKLDEYGLRYIFMDKLKSNPMVYRQISEGICMQNKKFDIMKNELINLNNLFQKKGIPIVMLKGVTLALEIYNENPGIRKSNDIDVFISPKDIDIGLDILGETGYVVDDTGETVSKKLINKYAIKMGTSIHYPVFSKKIKIENKIFKIEMDCHTSILHNIKNRDEIMQNMVARSVDFIVENQKMKILEIHDRILHLIVHLVKEYFRNCVRWNINGERALNGNLRFPINLLHDIAKLIEINTLNINWDILIERAKKYEIYDECLLIFNLLNEIYKGIIPLNIFNTNLDLNTLPCDKRFGRFYSIQEGLKNSKFFMLTLDEISENILSKFSNQRGFLFETEYAISAYKDHPYIEGTEILSETNNRKILGHITVYKKTDFLLLKIEKDADLGDQVVLTLATSKKNKITHAFVNRFLINTGNKSTHNKYSVYLCNAYIDIELKDLCVLIDKKLYIKIPFEFVFLSDQNFVFLDVDFPDFFNNLSKKEILKFKTNPIHNSNTFQYSPKLLSVFQSLYFS